MIAILEQHENCEWRSGVVGTGLLHRDKALLQVAPLRVLRCAYIEGLLGALLYDGVFQPLHGRFNPNTMNRHMTTMCRLRHILRVVSLSPWSVN
jgi:hypothetical protein